MSLTVPYTILLLGADNPLSLPLVRSLGAGLPGSKIHTISIPTKSAQISKFSKYVDHHHTIKGDAKECLIDEIAIIIKQTSADILLPVTEEYTQKISSVKHHLDGRIALPPLSSPDLLDSLVNKSKLAKLLAKNGFSTPKTYLLSEIDIHTLSTDFFPCLIKPVRGSSGTGIQKLDSIDSLEYLLPDLKTDQTIVQELIPGYDIDCSFLAVDGNIKAYTIQRGIASKGFHFSTAIHFKFNETVFKYVESLISETEYSGVAHLDFRMDSRDELPKLVDFNARYWFSMEGSAAAGINFAELNCLEAIKIPYPQPYSIECTYLMGKSSILNLAGLSKLPPNGHHPTYSDLKSRIKDPFPELLRYI